MSNFISRFYLFSKLSTSLVLFIILIFIGFLFVRAYLAQNGIINNAGSEIIESRLIALTTLTEKNLSNINSVKKLVTNNKQSIETVNILISEIKAETLADEAIIQLKKISEENQALKKEINSLLLK